MSSSSRARPFSFSPAVQDALGPSGPVNEAVRRALPSLFDGSVDALLQIVSVGARFPRVVVREGQSVPAGTPVGLFAGHVVVGPAVRGDFLVAVPPISVRGVPLHLAIDATASLARFPAPTHAGLYAHACDGGNLVAEWRALDRSPSFSVRVAVAGDVLPEQSFLTWDFDLHCVGDSYTLGDDDGRDWCAAGGGARDCDCAAPLPCPRARVLRTVADDSDAEGEEEADWTIATDGWPRR